MKKMFKFLMLPLLLALGAACGTGYKYETVPNLSLIHI